MSAAAQRLTALEAGIPGLVPAAAAAEVTASDFAALAAIDDARASADDRRHAAPGFARRALAGHPAARAA